MRNCELLKGLSGLKDIKKVYQVGFKLPGLGPGDLGPLSPARGSAVIQP